MSSAWGYWQAISRALNGSRISFAGFRAGVGPRTRRTGARIIVAFRGTRRKRIARRLRSRGFLYSVCRGRGQCLLCRCSSQRRRAIRLTLIVYLFQSISQTLSFGICDIPSSTNSAMAFAWRKHRFVASICHDWCWPVPASSAKSIGRKGR